MISLIQTLASHEHRECVYDLVPLAVFFNDESAQHHMDLVTKLNNLL